MARNGEASAQTRYEPPDQLSIAGYAEIDHLRTAHDLVNQHEISSTFASTIAAIRRRFCLIAMRDRSYQKIYWSRKRPVPIS
jgi:hypothetical protein